MGVGVRRFFCGVIDRLGPSKDLVHNEAVKKIAHTTFSILVVAALLRVAFLPTTGRAGASSLYTPFGGRVQEYLQKSEARCVKNTCGEISNQVQNVIRGAIEGPAAGLCAVISTPCAAVFLVGYGVCFAACNGAIMAAVEAINVCDVEEIKVGPPKKASVGILNIGTVNINLLGIVKFKLKLSELLPDISVLTPKIYEHKNYKTAGSWVLGDSLNILNLCGLADKGTSGLCKNKIIKTFTGLLAKGQKGAGDEAHKNAVNSGDSAEKAEVARKEAESDYATSCPLLNLLHQVGTSKNL